ETRRSRAGVATALSVIALIASVVAIGLSASRKSVTASSAVPNIAVVEKDFSIQATPPTVKSGLVDFTVANAGPSSHEFLIFRADQAPDAFPTGSDGRVDESSDQITKVFDSGDNIAANGSKVFHAALTPGTYVLVCNLPGHYKAGMHEAFTVH
ncbi:MAG TPA: sulfocyanin-like copper-binding protein, partial [Actinomycetota bacterium]|nr:sulfocyanin-like copper-binding protein [Actinomycetota bacterium]